MKAVWLAGVLALAVETAAAGPLCGQHPGAQASLAHLRTALARGRFVAYQPTSLQVIHDRSTEADPASIRADLRVLSPYFDSLVTYRADHGAQAVASEAEALGFRALIIGVWNPLDPAELAAALDTARAHPRLVVGLSLGNEMVLGGRARFEDLAALMRTVRAQAPGLAMSTTEPFHLFYEPAAAPALREMDFLLANVHPVFQPWFAQASAEDAAQFVVNVTGELAQTFCGPVLVKETGVPTAPVERGYTAARQAAFYEALSHRFPATDRVAYAYFVAFDAPWRAYDRLLGPGEHPEEARWGLFDERREPKPVMQKVRRLH